MNYLAAQLNNNPQNPGFLGLESSSTYHNPEDLVQFVISGLLAKGLKKGLFFAPDPYVKFKIGPGYSDQNSVFLPHHGQNCRTTVVENNIEPKWPEQVKLRFSEKPQNLKKSPICFEIYTVNVKKVEDFFQILLAIL